MLAAFSVSGQALSRQTLTNLKFEQRVNEQIPLGLSFRDESGNAVRLADCMNNKPAILVLGYYECPMLCNLVLNGLVEGLQDIKPEAVAGSPVIFISIDPEETAKLAAAKKEVYLRRYRRAGAARDWHFLTGDPQSIEAIARSIGFHYAFDPVANEYAHPSGLVFLSPKGRISQYLFGVTYPASEIKAALDRAGSEKSGKTVKDFLLLCFSHMPLTGEHSPAVIMVVRISAVATLLGLAAFVGVSIRRDRMRKRSKSAEGAK